MIKQMKITLLSDTCIGSGQGLGSTIDTDVCYDRNGFPYIPAKRLKGLLKEAARELNEDYDGFVSTKQIEDIFGISGSKEGSLTIDNAYLENYEEISREIQSYLHDNEHIDFTVDNILNQYTNVRFQTAIDQNGIAKDGSLRKMRVLNKGLSFFATIGMEEKDLDIIQACVKILRHTGMNRNRGYGFVECCLLDAKEKQQAKHLAVLHEGYNVLKLKLQAVSSLMISDVSSDESLPYIKGSAIYGYFANQYIKIFGLNDFYRLFFRSSLRFTDATITNDKYDYTIPSPYCYYKAKDKQKYYNVINENKSEIQKSMLRGKTIVAQENKIELISNQAEMSYHHQRPIDRSIGHVVESNADGSGEFFQYATIQKDTKFVSYIHGQKEDLEKIMTLLENTSYFRVGKSKNAQYGKVALLQLENVTNQIQKVTGRKLGFVLRSDYIPSHIEKSVETTLLEKIQQEIGLKPIVIKKYIQYGLAGGYNAKWNLPKQQNITIKGGTVLICEFSSEVKMNRIFFAGQRQMEGYGEVLVFDVMKCNSYELELIKSEKSYQKTKIIHSKTLIENILKTRLYTLLEQDAIIAAQCYLKNNNSITPTQVGRSLLKIKSCHKFEDFKNWVEEIKQKSKKSEIEFILKIVKENTEKFKKTSSDSNRELELYYLEKFLVTIKVGRRLVS